MESGPHSSGRCGNNNLKFNNYHLEGIGILSMELTIWNS